jgi:NADH-quinone oxidoreductase subunit D
MGWWMTLEKLLLKYLNVQVFGVIIMELARITDHLICNSILGDTGAYTGFLYVFNLERYIEIYEEIWVPRLTTNMGRIGGLKDWSQKHLNY